MPLYGQAPVQSIYPGSIGLFVGEPIIYGLQNSVVGSNSPDPSVQEPELFPAGAASRPVVVPARVGGLATTRRGLIWRVFAGGPASPPMGAFPVDIQLEASIDNVAANYQVIDTYSGTGDSGHRIVLPDALSSYRFFRLKNAGSDVTIVSDVTVL